MKRTIFALLLAFAFYGCASANPYPWQVSTIDSPDDVKPQSYEVAANDDGLLDSAYMACAQLWGPYAAIVKNVETGESTTYICQDLARERKRREK